MNLSYAPLNEAWNIKHKPKKVKTDIVPSPFSNQDSNSNIPDSNILPHIQDPIVIRISDKNIIENLKIYNEDYKSILIMNIIANYFKNKNMKQIEFKETKSQPQDSVEPFFQPLDIDDLKEFINLLFLVILFLFIYNKFINKIC